MQSVNYGMCTEGLVGWEFGLGSVGMLLTDSGQFAAAISHFERVVELGEQLGKPDLSRDKEALASVRRLARQSGQLRRIKIESVEY